MKDVPELEDEQHGPQMTIRPQSSRRPVRVVPTPKPQTRAYSQTAPTPQKQTNGSPLNMI